MRQINPLPMKDTANPQPMHPASEKMSQWMNSYMPTVMNKIMAGSVGPTNMGMGNQGGAGISDMLFKAIHPDTFERVLNLLKPESKEPIPRQGGGEADPNKDYVVGEKGPEIFRPNVPGDIIPGPGGGQLKYMGQEGQGGWDPLLAGRQAFGETYNPEPAPMGSPKTFGEGWIGQNIGAPIERWTERGRVAAGFPATTEQTWWNRSSTPPLGTTASPLGEPDFALGHTLGHAEPAPAPAEEGPPPIPTPAVTMPPPLNMPERGPSPTAPTPPGYGTNPEAMDMIRNIYGSLMTPRGPVYGYMGPSRGWGMVQGAGYGPHQRAALAGFGEHLGRLATDPAEFARSIFGNQAQMYGHELTANTANYGEDVRAAGLPWQDYYHRAMGTHALSEMGKPTALPGGYWDPKKGFVPQPKETVEERWQSHVMQTEPHIQAAYAAAGLPFDRNKWIDDTRRDFRMPPIERPKPKLPDYETFEARALAKGSKMSKKDLQATYEKLKKAEAE